jgi:hypothetical protein
MALRAAAQKDAAMKSVGDAAAAEEQQVQMTSGDALLDPLLEEMRADDAEFGPGPAASGVIDGESSSPTSNVMLFRQTWQAQVGVGLCWLTTSFYGALLAFVPSEKDATGHPDVQFRLILVYVSLFAELAGKQLNVSSCCSSWLKPLTCLKLHRQPQRLLHTIRSLLACLKL